MIPQLAPNGHSRSIRFQEWRNLTMRRSSSDYGAYPLMTSEGSADGDSDRSDAGSSAPSAGSRSGRDDLDLEHLRVDVRGAEDYPSYSDLRRDLVRGVYSEEASSGSERHSSRSPSPSSHHLVRRFHDLGLADSELSDHVDYLSHEGDDDSRITESDGELSNASPAEDDDDVDESYDEVPNPPELPPTSEERLQEVWPLGEASFNIFLCPVTHDIMRDPVVSADGYTYERSAIARWFETSRKSPVTGQTLPHAELVPNHSVRTLLKSLIDLRDAADRVPSKASGARRHEKDSSHLASPSPPRPAALAASPSAPFDVALLGPLPPRPPAVPPAVRRLSAAAVGEEGAALDEASQPHRYHQRHPEAAAASPEPLRLDGRPLPPPELQAAPRNSVSAPTSPHGAPPQRAPRPQSGVRSPLPSALPPAPPATSATGTSTTASSSAAPRCDSRGSERPELTPTAPATAAPMPRRFVVGTPPPGSAASPSGSSSAASGSRPPSGGSRQPSSIAALPPLGSSPTSTTTALPPLWSSLTSAAAQALDAASPLSPASVRGFHNAPK